VVTKLIAEPFVGPVLSTRVPPCSRKSMC